MFVTSILMIVGTDSRSTSLATGVFVMRSNWDISLFLIVSTRSVLICRLPDYLIT